MLKKKNSNASDYINASQSQHLTMPLINSMISKFTPGTANNQNTTTKMRNESIIKELSLELKGRDDLLKNFENISKELILMGFSPNMVLHSFMVFRYQTVEDGIEALSKNSEGLWNHRYYAGEDDLCFICDFGPDDHRNIRMLTRAPSKPVIQINPSVLEKKLSIKKEPEKEFNLKINVNSCQICFLEINERENKFNLQCQHQFCKECMIEYLKEEIRNSRVTEIRCPSKNCQEKFTEIEIKGLVDDEFFYKYKKFLQRAKIKDDNTLTVCPITDCEGYAKKDAPEVAHEVVLEVRNDLQKENLVPKKRLTCSNGHNFCSECNQAWHGQTDCGMDKEIKEFATFSGHIVKKCPQCKVWTEKNEGCNHMTCKMCQYNWCWLCEKECLPDHYMTRDTPCYGRQFNHATEEDLEIAMMFAQPSALVNFFIFFILTFQIINRTVTNLYNNANRRDQTPPPKVCTFITILCINICILVFSLIFNGFVFITMLFNLQRLNTINNNGAKLLIIVTFFILFFVLYISANPVMTMIWFGIANLYAIYRLLRV